jgi:hypothetical protein
MVFCEAILTSVFVLTATSSPHCAQSNQVRNTVQSAKSLKSSGSIQKPAKAGSFESKPFTYSLSESHSALAGGPPADLASELSRAVLPASSKKTYSLPGLAGANFLAPTRLQTTAFPSFSAPGLNPSKLRDAKQPDLSKVR